MSRDETLSVLVADILERAYPQASVTAILTGRPILPHTVTPAITVRAKSSGERLSKLGSQVSGRVTVVDFGNTGVDLDHVVTDARSVLPWLAFPGIAMLLLEHRPTRYYAHPGMPTAVHAWVVVASLDDQDQTTTYPACREAA